MIYGDEWKIVSYKNRNYYAYYYHTGLWTNYDDFRKISSNYDIIDLTCTTNNYQSRTLCF
jgi:hypothetical protein